jgi:hypothetical protein
MRLVQWHRLEEDMTLVVNLFGGPGSGKSTTAAGVFHDLKMNGTNVEIAHEFAKDLVWDKSDRMHFECQPRIAGEQIWRIERLIGQVDVVITDSPVLLCSLYHKSSGPVEEAFDKFLIEQCKHWPALNIYINRSGRPYNPRGRNQTLEEALDLDAQIRDLLARTETQYTTTTVEEATDYTYRQIRDYIGGT